MMRMKPNGTLPIQLGWRNAKLLLDITGGPYDAYPDFREDDTFGVCVRAERVPQGGYNAHLPIQDFSVPKDTQAVESVLKEVLGAAMLGRRVYIGCMGGWGRTGLFMALLAKAAGVEHPVEFVRETYTSHAVETEPQYKYVQQFDVSAIRKWMPRAAWKARFQRLFS